ncbi:hypothetical protein VTH06DRAFT_3368 [Thermothelomyces fergusii]
MSSSSRRRSLRPTDLTMPSTPSPPAQSSQQPASGPSQPEQSSRQSAPSATKRKREPDLDAATAADDDDIFGDSAGADVVDLVDKTEVPPDVSKSPEEEENKKYIRMSTLDCVICMDSAKDLTVTHCGHLFCSACLHSALNMDQSRRICPICRQKIDRQPPGGARFGQKAKGYYPLELKLMTRKTIGARREPSTTTTATATTGRDGSSS